jgi:hypothetical protein
MTRLQRAAGAVTAALFVSVAGACSTNSLGNVLGGVLGGGQQQELTGTVQGVDTRSQQIFVQQSNGQTIGIGYDSRTQVVYQNQTYSVNSLERGDEVTVRINDSNGGSNNSNYYTDYVRVDRSVSSTGTGTSGNVQTIQGTVRQVDVANGWFTMSVSNQGNITVSLPYNTRSTDVNKFRNLRPGDYVRLYGTYLNNSRVELRQFY